MAYSATKEYSPRPSIKGNFWLVPCYDAELVERIKSYHCVSDTVAGFIALRHPSIAQDQSLVSIHFLDPKIRHLMVDPCKLIDMEKGLSVIHNHITSGNKIAIFADYDVDGACSCALLYNFLLQCGTNRENILVHIPDRQKEGYGPNIGAISSLVDRGAKLIISVDCGIVAFEPISHARELGCDFVVIDHHKSASTMPNANAVINPNRADESLDLGYLSAAGVVFMLCAGLANYFPDLAAELKKHLMDSLDIVAIATICDVVPLVGLNRAFVKQGLRIINQRKRPAIDTILSHQNINGAIYPKDIGFKLGPVINACGRVGDSTYGFKALITSSQNEADGVTTQMLAWNRLRADIEKRTTAEVLKEIECVITTNESENFIFVYGEGWNEGVIGIVASRIQERYSRLSIIGSLFIHEDGQKYVKASCRSVAGVDIGLIVLEGLKQGFLVKGGGHKMAAGFTIHVDRLNNFRQMIECMVSGMLLQDSRKELVADCVISPDCIGSELLNDLDLLEPFGNGNEGMLFLVPDVVVVNSKLVGQEHISVTLKNPFSNFHFHAICFRCVGTQLGDFLIAGAGKNLSVVCNIEQQEYRQKRTASVVIVDALLSPSG